MTQSNKIHGCGLGFRREQLSDLQNEPKLVQNVDFFELAPENWIGIGGAKLKSLRQFSERFPFVCHGLSLSIGSTDPLDFNLIRSIKAFMHEHNIGLYTEHLSWCSQNGHLYDLLPIPFSEENARWVAHRVKQVQDCLGQAIGLENSSYYFSPSGGEMNEAEFINLIVQESGCFIHLDVNNLYVNSQNLNYDPVQFLAKLNLERVGYMHVAGHYVEADGWLVDTHGAAVIDPVWDLLAHTFNQLGPSAPKIPICLERDFNFPKLNELFSELNVIRALREAKQVRAKP